MWLRSASLTTFALLILIAGCGTEPATQTATPLPTVALPTAVPTATSPPAGATATLPAPATQPADTTPTTATEAAATPTTEPDEDPDSGTEPVSPLDDLEIVIAEFATGVEWPVGITSAGDGSGRLFIVEKSGTIAVILDGVVQEERFLNILNRVDASRPEQGLLGLAFHPDFHENGWLYVNYTDLNGDTVISRFQADDERERADPASEEILMLIEQPANNHNGGHLLFGPDGYLYIGTGDGGGAGDTFEHAQNGLTLLGAMLRIDVNGDMPYAIPPDNPFVNDPSVLDELWAIGLRNPWRYAFDPLTNDLYIADVGQNRIEEVSFQPADSPGGENYGWPIMEGSECFRVASCDRSGLTPPVAEYTHSDGCSITGGEVYRGTAYPAMQGIYFFSDFCSGNVWGLTNVDGDWHVELFIETGLSVSSFGTDEAGEIYLADMYAGVIYWIVGPE